MFSFLRVFRITAVILFSFSIDMAYGQEQEFDDSAYEFFEAKVRPLLVERCFECHGPESSFEGGLGLASRDAMISGGDTGPGIVVGDAANSLIIDSINYGDVYQMPPDTKMSAEEIEILTKWVNMGAPWPKAAEIHVEAKEAFDIQKRKSEHWCWQPIKNPKVPSVEDTRWPSDPIDHFVLKKLEEAKLKPAQLADKSKLIRRLYFDLIGLPPTPQQVRSFIEDRSEEAYDKVVDALLDSPEFGERWARHWMDLTRYAETCGHEFDYPIPHAYQYRDYLIRAFNSDVPYNKFIEEHIAGDLLGNPRLNPERQFNESVIGTGFWFLGEATHGPVDVRGDEAGHIDNRIDVMTKTFLGLTVACARCHDHKFDAISTKDYYALAGFLQSSRRQEAMLDFDRRIEKLHQSASELVSEGQTLLSELVNRLGRPESTQIHSYLEAAIEIFRDESAWAGGQKQRFQGEDLTALSDPSGGDVKIQKLGSRESLSWEGDQQLWWIDAKEGDTLKMDFELGKKDTTFEWEVVADFTKASDYGIFEISVDEIPLNKRIDFYHRKVTKTGPLVLGTIKLDGRQHSLKFTNRGHHKKAIPRNMFGLDWIEFRPKRLARPDQWKAVADRRGLDQEVLARLVTGLMEASDSETTEIPWIDAFANLATLDEKQWVTDAAQMIEKEAISRQQWESESELFEDFSAGLPADWFAEGFAFEGEPKATFGATGPLVPESGTVHSGSLGANFCGVLRSPTFELNHDQIHWRVRGRNVTIRLIIDGYVMDVHNALLYKGCTIKVGETKGFEWQTQASDIKNYRGHRAHLEIIDHGDGYFELDEIRFSNSARPPKSKWPVMLAGFKDELDDESFASWISDCVVRSLVAREPTLLSWLIDNQLETMICSERDRVGSNGKSIGKRNFVSTESPSSSLNTIPIRKLSERLDSIRARLESNNESTPSPIFAVAMTDGTGEDEYVFVRGNHKTLGDVVERRFLAALSAKPLNPENGSGRLLLARKITAPNNPLTSRVVVNRIWHHLMGAGIVASVDNFGVLGKSPTHPELLDHLAMSFQRDGWSVKRLIGRIVRSSTYRMASTINDEAQTVDPDNLLLHRARIKRLQGEAIRDSILQISGRLDKKMFGPSVPIHLTEFMSGRGRPGKTGPLDGAGRRSLYVSVRRNFLSPMMLAFDTPIPFNSIGRRNRSNVPAQALILMNDPFVVEQAENWARRLISDVADVQPRIETIYWEALGRAPDDWEKEQAIEFLGLQAKALDMEPDEIASDVRVWKDLCHVLFNLKEFIFIE